MHERQGNLVGAGLWELSRILLPEVQGQNNLQTAKEHLTQGSVLLYSNHYHDFDPFSLGRVIDSHLTPLEHVDILTSRRHLDSQRGPVNRLQNFLVDKMKAEKGFNPILVVQNYDKEKYPDAEEFNKRALVEAVRDLRLPGRILSIAPEGTRSRTGGLLEAQEGLEPILRLSRKTTLALPIAMEPTLTTPSFIRARVLVGEPFSYDDIIAEQESHPDFSVSDLMMLKIARLLSPQRRGFYGPLVQRYELSPEAVPA